MKTLILTFALALVSLTTFAKDITVSAKGKSVTLTTEQIQRLKACNNETINKTLEAYCEGGQIKNNEVADAIISLLKIK